MTQVKNVLLVGAWKKNLGDDLFLKVICEKFPTVHFHIITDKMYRTTYQIFSNLHLHFTNSYILKLMNIILRKMGLPDIYYARLSRACQCAVFYGGSLYQQDKNWRRTAKKRLDIVRIYKTCFVVGSNFGPYQEQAYFDFYFDLFRKMRDVCFRDAYSARLFANLRVRSAPDVVLALGERSSREKAACPCDRPYMVISVINLELDHVSRHKIREHRDTYERWIADLALAIEKKGMDVLLMSFCDQEGDHEAGARIRSMRNSEHVFTHSHRDIEQSLKIIQGSQGVIATRFHAMILGWLLKKPILPIAYGQKMLSVIKEYGYEGIYVTMDTLQGVTPDDALERMRVFENVGDLSKAAERQFDEFRLWVNT